MKIQNATKGDHQGEVGTDKSIDNDLPAKMAFGMKDKWSLKRPDCTLENTLHDKQNFSKINVVFPDAAN